ncbi:MAG: SDR family NAD(P)-dependent oxidoreductase [Actinomycetota bacterium]|nr:SDR family NAD(P)-dependent oxidoreductase [Actinomycetota bacterium]
MTYDLNGKVVLVTGGARGIGLAVAQAAYGRGASVALVDLDESIAAESAGTIGDRTIGIGANVADREQIEAAFTRTIERFGKVDVVIANAGIAPETTSTLAIPADEWERVLEVNLLGVWRTVRAGMEQVITNQGQFVLVSSSYAFMNGVVNSSYATAKAGVEAFGRSLRIELTAHGASATVAYFGWITTDMVTTAFSDPIVSRMRKLAPAFLTRQIRASKAGEAVIDGIERRDPRIVVPFEYKVFLYLRGLAGPFMDWRFQRDPRVAAIVRDAERLTEERVNPSGEAGG